MAVQIEIAGKVVDVDDSFKNLTPEEQQATVNDIAAHIGKIPDPVISRARDLLNNDERFQSMTVQKAAEGIPLLGAFAPQAGAALNTLANKVSGKFKPTYAENLEDQKAASELYQQEHPIASEASKFAGGAIATAPLAASATAAKVLGMSGTLPQMIGRGAASGAAIGGADAALRGESPVAGAGIGAGAGAALPLVGRGIGKVAQSLRPTVRPGLPTENVNGIDVPQLPSTQSGVLADAQYEQRALSGMLGPEVQQLAQTAFDARAAATAEARAKLSTDLGGSPPATPGTPPAVPPTPHEAGQQVITDLAQQHNDQVQQRAAQALDIGNEGNAIRNDLIPEQAARPPQMPATAYDAAEGVGGAIQQRATESRAASRARYDELGRTEGEFSPAGFGRVGNVMRDALNSGEPNARVRVNDTTPQTREGIALIEENFQPRPVNAAERGGMQIGPDGRPMERPITAMDVESVRQQLIPLLQSANAAARAPGGSAADARGMRRLIDAFDSHVRNVIEAGGFSGDGQAYLRQLEAARAGHAQHRAMFSARGQGDVVGPVVERIIGKHPGQEMTPDAIAQAMYGAPNAPGGGNTVAVTQRALQIVGGHQTPEGTAIRQGFLSHILDVPAGTEPLSPAQQADRIVNAINGTKGRLLAQVLFSPEERQRLLEHAAQLRSLVPGNGPMSAVDRQVMRLAGADGHAPPSPDVAVSMLYPSSGTTPATTELASRLKSTLSPESWNTVKQGMWEHLTTKPEGVIDFGPQAISQRINTFLSKDIADVMFSPQERQMMRIIADEYKKQIPVPGSKSSSGSDIAGATLATRALKSAHGNLLTLLGGATHGFMGAAVGHAAGKTLEFAKNRAVLNKAKDTFLGKGTKGEVSKNYERAAAILSKAATPLIGQ